MLGPLLEVAMSKKCTLFWPEAHFEVRSVKTYGLGPLLEAEMLTKCAPMFGPLLDVQMSFRAAGARDCAPCQKVSKAWVLQQLHKRWQAWEI